MTTGDAEIYTNTLIVFLWVIIGSTLVFVII